MTTSSYGLKRCIEVIKEAVPIERVAAEYTELRSVWEGRYEGRCPFPDHEDRTPSFHVYAEERRFKCYGCQLFGDVLDIEELCGRHTETWTAVVALSMRYGVELAERSERWHEAQDRKAEYLDARNRVLGNVLKRRLYKSLILPCIDMIEDPVERERELERSWREWDRAEYWPGLAGRLLAGNEHAVRAIATEKAKTDLLVGAGAS